MTPAAFRLLRALSSGRSLSGARHAQELGVSRAAVWKLVGRLRDAGVPVEARPGEGYRLAWPVDLLDAERIRAGLPDASVGVRVVDATSSTNAALARDFEHRRALAAEYQQAGRGRRGRCWQSPPAAGIWLSFGYRFECGLPRLGALALVAGIATADAVEAACGALDAPLRLKWPNDVMLDARKLGGILVEIRGAADGACDAVIGVGINVRYPDRGAAVPGQPWTDLHRAGADTVDRNGLAARLIAGLDRACAGFEAAGFAPFAERWAELDSLAGRGIEVRRADGSRMQGRADGVTRRGELCVIDADGRRVRLGSGEVSVRAD